MHLSPFSWAARRRAGRLMPASPDKPQNSLGHGGALLDEAVRGLSAACLDAGLSGPARTARNDDRPAGGIRAPVRKRRLPVEAAAAVWCFRVFRPGAA